MKINSLSETEYNPFYKRYIQKVPQDLTLIQGYMDGEKAMVRFFKNIPDKKHNYRYESDKWSVKEVIQHIIDTERIFMYRCLRISRHDKTPLAGFEQDDFIAPSRAHQKDMENLIDEYKAVRNHSIEFLKSLHDNDLKFIGNASGNQMSARAAACIVLGHEIWHREILKERYL
ncbi:DinB family protein [Gaetbulibacter aestuarii]|uniref:DinB family protein n=1 Tax=Gaetbulibacter aestuarii TaxID=1502358 RepID=A0ABW7MZ67_9FLAO